MGHPQCLDQVFYASGEGQRCKGWGPLSAGGAGNRSTRHGTGSARYAYPASRVRGATIWSAFCGPGAPRPGNSGAPMARMRCSSVRRLTTGPSTHSPPFSASVASWMASFGLLAHRPLAKGSIAEARVYSAFARLAHAAGIGKQSFHPILFHAVSPFSRPTRRTSLAAPARPPPRPGRAPRPRQTGWLA